DALQDMGAAWKADSGGSIELVIYPGGVAGDEPDMVRKMRIGQLQAAALSEAGLHQILPDIRALMMPMVLRSNAELDCVRDRIAPELERRFEAKGFKVLNWGDAGWIRFFTTKPVVRPEDLKPLKLFVWAGDDTAVADAWKDAGYQPVPLAVPDILTGLQSGLIDAVPTTPIAALSYQWFGLAPHMTDVKWAPLVGATVITMQAWNLIPDPLKPQLLQAAQSVGARLRQQVRPSEDAAIKAMVSRGLTIHPVPPAIQAEWEASATAGYRNRIASLVRPAMLAEVERSRDECRAAQLVQ
ncbi:MAG TPA: TRAP transporter substrate-binding protein DctP, partial [Bradyrhizobium sp.]|nr:TRAP transporter substrate-binding protein DctP [Bradyrhizobium sp.]